MTKQGRNQSGRFASKSDEPRSVRTMRLTDTAWAKLGEIADSRGITRADLVEEWTKQGSPPSPDQLQLFDFRHAADLSTKELVTRETRKTATELAHRLNRSSALLTNWKREGKDIAQRTKNIDPDGIAWEPEPGTKKYRPIL